MFIDSDTYESACRRVAAEDGELLVAVSFWGEGGEELLRERGGRPVKVVCNLISGATNPKTVKALRKIKRVEVRQHDRLHAKVIVSEQSALVGSANFSANGLGLEGTELAGWAEAALSTRSAKKIGAVRDWFAQRWDEAREITPADLREASKRWQLRRNHRPLTANLPRVAFDLDDLTPADLADRQIYLACYRDRSLSEEAETRVREYHEELSDRPILKSKFRLPPMYEQWSELPTDADLIDIHDARPDGPVRCWGVYERTHNLKFTYDDGEEGHLAICRSKRKLFGRTFGLAERKALVERIEPHLDAILGDHEAQGDKDCVFLPLSAVLRVLSSRV